MSSIFQRPDARRAVVFGGGGVAARATAALASAGFATFVVAEAIDASFRAELEQGGGSYAQRERTDGDLAGAQLAVAASGDDGTDARVVEAARAAGVASCDASRPLRGTATLDAVVRAAQTFERMRAYAAVVVGDPERRERVVRAIAALPFERLAALNPVEAEDEAEAAIAREAARPDHTAATATAICVSRASPLAMTQTRHVAARLAERGIATTILNVSTAGDRDRSHALENLGSTNVFVGELEAALRERRADYAVHSCKDLPSALASDMTIAAISSREDPRDAFCSERFASFDALPPGAVVGTSSPRRRAQMEALRPDLEYRNVRGNVGTRLRKLREGEYDAIVLAMAGLNRLRVRAAHTVAFDPELLVPAVAQGALAVETLAGAHALAAELRAAVNDPATELCVRCERAALRALRAGCSAPIGIHARLEGRELRVAGAYATAAGAIRRFAVSRHVDGLEGAEAAGVELAAGLEPPLAGRRLVLALDGTRHAELLEALRATGAAIDLLRAGDAGPSPAEGLPDMLLFPSSGSVAAAAAWIARLPGRPAIAACGAGAAGAAAAAGLAPDAVSLDPSPAAFVAAIEARLAS